MVKSISFIRMLVLSALLASVIISNAQTSCLSFEDGITSDNQSVSTPDRRTVDLGAEGIEITWTFSGARIAEVDVENDTYHLLNIEGFTHLAQVGAPALPVHNELIAMPEGASVEIEVLKSQYYEYEGFMIHPALEPARDTEGAEEPSFMIDEQLYQTNAHYPANIAEIPDIYYNRGIPLALLQIVPVQFNPVTSTIRVYTEIKVKLHFTGGEASFASIANNNSLHFTSLLKRNVLNSASIPDGISPDAHDAKSVAKEYIIITHDEYLTQAEELAEWKRQLGYSVDVVSGPGWTAAQVKDSIHTRYNNWTPRPDFFVIIGDHDGSFAVPAEIHYVSGNAFATDLYFACMDGASDWHPDMSHGRISVSSSAEAQIVVDKIINYEKNPVNNAAFYENALNCAQYQDDNGDGYADRRFCHTSEEIRNYLVNDQGYTSRRIYYTNTSANVSTLRYNNSYYSNGSLLPDGLRSASFNWSGGQTDITNAIDSGKFIVFHRDHGYSGGSGWAHPYYTTTSMNSLSNGSLLPVVFSINCHTGEFQLSNCFAEKFVRMSNKGAVGVVAAAYYSYSGYNDGLAVGMMDAIWADPGLYPEFGSCGSGYNYTIGTGNSIYTMGDVVNQGLYAMEQNVGWSGDHQYQYELFHYFGDPAMKIWTANPNDTIITATHANTIDPNASSFSVSGSTPFALATLVQDNEIIGKASLDASGAGTINYVTSGTANDVTLTISKYNCKPYISILTVSSSGATASAGSDQNICDNEIAVLAGSIGGSATSSEWTSAGDGLFDDPYALSTNYTPGPADLLNDSVCITLTTDDPDGSGPLEPASDSLMLYFIPLPGADAGDDADICEGTLYPLNATAADYESLLWTTSGDGSFDNDTILNAVYNPGINDLSNGSVELSLTAYAQQSCSPDTTDSMMLYITLNPTADAGSDAVICEDESYLLNGNALNYSTLSWTSDGDGSYDNDTILSPVYFPGANDISNGSVVLSLTAGAIAPCNADAVDNMTLDIQSFPGQPQMPAGPDSVDVYTTAASLFTTVSGSYTDSLIWSIEPDTAATLSVNDSVCTSNWNASFSGLALLTVAGVNDCDTTWSEAKEVYIYLSTAIHELSDNIDIRIVPNPNSGEFQLRVSGIREAMLMEIIDMGGNVYVREQLSVQSEALYTKDMHYGHLSQGVYLIKIYNSRTVITKKLVIN